MTITVDGTGLDAAYPKGIKKALKQSLGGYPPSNNVT